MIYWSTHISQPHQVTKAPPGMVYSAISIESLRTTRAINYPDAFSTAIKPLVTRMGR